MDMFFLMVGIVVMCSLLCVVELLARVLERTNLYSRMTQRTVYAVPSRSAARVTKFPVSGPLPERDSIGKVYSLSDHFADHYQKVINS